METLGYKEGVVILILSHTTDSTTGEPDSTDTEYYLLKIAAPLPVLPLNLR